TRFGGVDSGDELGHSVASGDVNGDGFGDLILGAPYGASTGNTRYRAGEVHLIYGKSTPWADADLLNPPSGVTRFWGADSSDNLRSAERRVGKDGSGFGALILCAPAGASTGNTRNDAGEVDLVYGRATP